MFGIKAAFLNMKRRIKKDGNIEFPPVMPEKQVMMFDAVNLDTNNTCNQRCRFCFTDFSNTKTNMDVETFKSVLKVLPYVRDYAGGGYGFYFSCIYEPTINPNFLKCLSLLPPIGKNKCFITTNLARPMTKEYITEMIPSNVHLINISIESLNEYKFEYITQNKKFDVYKNNLKLLEEAINENKNHNPKFRFITILLKENKDEIVDLIKYTYTHFPLESHEVRTPYINQYQNMGWNKKQFMAKNETEEIINQIQSLDYHVDMIIESVEDLECLYETKQLQSDDDEDNDMYSQASKKLKEVEDYEYLFLRITPYGTCIDKMTNEPEDIPLNNAEDYFKQKLFDLYENKANVAYCQKFDDENVINSSAFIMVDELIENDAILAINGWCCPDRKVNINKLIIRFTGMNGDIHYCHTSTKLRPDADSFKQKEEGWCGGYSTYIAKSKLKSKNYILDFLYKDGSGNTICYRWDYSIEFN